MNAILSHLSSKTNYLNFRQPYTSRAQPQTTFENLFKNACNFEMNAFSTKSWPILCETTMIKIKFFTSD